LGEALASPSIRHKILILNSTIDRETGPSSQPFTATDFVAAIAKAGAESRGFTGAVSLQEYKAYVTHLIHLEGPGTPKVDKAELNSLGIETLRLYGRRMEGAKSLRYDEKALLQALEATIGRRDPKTERSRRNTLDN